MGSRARALASAAAVGDVPTGQLARPAGTGLVGVAGREAGGVCRASAAVCRAVEPSCLADPEPGAQSVPTTIPAAPTVATPATTSQIRARGLFGPRRMSCVTSAGDRAAARGAAVGHADEGDAGGGHAV